MPGSRTIKTLVALLMAMTIGAVALTLMQVAPPIDMLAAVATGEGGPAKVVHQTSVPIQPLQWRNIIIHASSEGRDIANRCHFIVNAEAGGEGGFVATTDLWRGQAEGQHAFVAGYDYNSDSIGVCLNGDFSRNPPSREQYFALVSLVQYLQEYCNIKPANVYFYGQLVRIDSPGKAFPNDFASRLVNPSR
jgi:hypothetical protein